MKNQIAFILFLTSILGFSQFEVKLLKNVPLNTSNFAGCDYNFNYYHFTNTILYKTNEKTTLNYSNYLYGNINSVDISNPLKIVVFYRDFNTVVLLDSQLNETDVIQIPYDVSFVSKGTANHVWLFTTNTQIIENYNFKTNTVLSSSQTLKDTKVKNMKSTENFVYLHTTKGIYTYDYLGNFINEYKQEEIEDFQFNNRILYTLSKDTIYQVKEKRTPYFTTQISKIKKFFTLNNHFFIFDNTQLYFYFTEKSKIN